MDVMAGIFLDLCNAILLSSGRVAFKGPSFSDNVCANHNLGFPEFEIISGKELSGPWQGYSQCPSEKDLNEINAI
ncbi:hypothetical protein [Niveispirillum fermenti]|uniref:hypothetical protein n=1 Tax=Niveispirillum fermenti TaxID=1233113 RepID=UPI003A881437